MMQVVKTYSGFNERRMSDPWVAEVSLEGKLEFSNSLGGYTGRRRSGEAGDLYINEPQPGQIYAFGQKDYRGGRRTDLSYVRWTGTEFEDIDKCELVEALNQLKAAQEKQPEVETSETITLDGTLLQSREMWWNGGGEQLWNAIRQIYGTEGCSSVTVPRKIAKVFCVIADDLADRLACDPPLFWISPAEQPRSNTVGLQ